MSYNNQQQYGGNPYGQAPATEAGYGYGNGGNVSFVYGRTASSACKGEGETHNASLDRTKWDNLSNGLLTFGAFFALDRRNMRCSSMASRNNNNNMAKVRTATATATANNSKNPPDCPSCLSRTSSAR